MRVHFLLGPAGSGKTYRCLEEIRAALRENPAGRPLIFLAPKQATFQLERQLLADETLAGYSRLHIVSFERLASFVYDALDQCPPPLLDEEGRVMVLRALLARHQNSLKVFRSAARLPGFARQISQVLRELQRHQLDPNRLAQAAHKVGPAHQLDHKLHDLALILDAYRDWLSSHELQDSDHQLELAARALPALKVPHPDQTATPLNAPRTLRVEHLWLDGFAQMTPQERHLLGAFLPVCDAATLAFCLEAEPSVDPAWYSPWTLLSQTFRQCRVDVAALPEARVEVNVLSRRAKLGRFPENPALRHLEEHWSHPQPFTLADAEPDPKPLCPSGPIQLFACPHPEGESIMAAQEILRFVRGGHRYRDIAVQVRHLEGYHDVIRRVFARYQIPFFLDRRQSVAHHPLAELTRCALRTLAHGWKRDDWFGVLKSGLVHASESDIDWLENEALARGWEGTAWHKDWEADEESQQASALHELRRRLTQPFQRLIRTLGDHPNGRELAEGLRQLWDDLRVGSTLEQWSQGAPTNPSMDRPPASRSSSSLVLDELPSEKEDEDEDEGRRTNTDGKRFVQDPHPIHATVWEQMQSWLDNLQRAFARDSLSLSEWLPVLEAGLSGLTVGVIPPVLDQVLVGAIDRSRNPDLKLTLVLGLNEGVFPAPPTAPVLLTETDRNRLEDAGYALGPGAKTQLGHERFYGYIACTRARERLILSYSARDTQGRALNPSSLVHHLQRLFPDLAPVEFSPRRDWIDSMHAYEMIVPLLGNQARDAQEKDPLLAGLENHPAFAPVLERLAHLRPVLQLLQLSPDLAHRLHGPALQTSVSAIEKFASCPFRFFVDSGLGVEERKLFELDIRQQGSFQHEVLARFHQSLQADGKKWRELSPADARKRIGIIADGLIPEFEHGILEASGHNRFLADTYKSSLQQFIGVIVGWMTQYAFDPAEVELGFGLKPPSLPPWRIDLGEGHQLSFVGRIDRIDLWMDPAAEEARCVVIDYKSGQRKVDPVLMEHGVQQQLPAYLNVLRRLQNPAAVFGVNRLIPAGVFYVSLRGKYDAGQHRREVLDQIPESERAAYTHQGFADFHVLRQLDTRKNVRQGDQFPYRLTAKDELYKGNTTLVPTAEFLSLLDAQEALLVEAGRSIYQGDVRLDPWKKGRDCACDQCDFASVCRIDPWTHEYRALQGKGRREKEE